MNSNSHEYRKILGCEYTLEVVCCGALAQRGRSFILFLLWSPYVAITQIFVVWWCVEAGAH